MQILEFEVTERFSDNVKTFLTSSQSVTAEDRQLCFKLMNSAGENNERDGHQCHIHPTACKIFNMIVGFTMRSIFCACNLRKIKTLFWYKITHHA